MFCFTIEDFCSLPQKSSIGGAIDENKKDRYLNTLISKENNGLIKVITGMRRCFRFAAEIPGLPCHTYMCLVTCWR